MVHVRDCPDLSEPGVVAAGPLKCAINVKFTLDFKDLIQKKRE